MTDKEMMDLYIRLVPFLAEVSGPACEIVIHDVTNPEHSIVAIGNNVSGRSIGNPMTDYAKELQQKGAYADTEYFSNYKGRTKDGDFISSTYFIKNEGRLIGMLCVNKEMAPVQELNKVISTLFEKFQLTIAEEQEEATENLDYPVTNYIHSRISETIARTGIKPSRMSREEKIRIVHALDDEKVLMMKGAVAEIAAQLDVSVPTIYRYLSRKSATTQESGR